MPKQKKPNADQPHAESLREYVSSLSELNRLNATLLNALSSLVEKLARKHKKIKKSEPRLLQSPDRKRGGKK